MSLISFRHRPNCNEVDGLRVLVLV